MFNNLILYLLTLLEYIFYQQQEEDVSRILLLLACSVGDFANTTAGGQLTTGDVSHHPKKDEWW